MVAQDAYISTSVSEYVRFSISSDHGCGRVGVGYGGSAMAFVVASIAFAVLPGHWRLRRMHGADTLFANPPCLPERPMLRLGVRKASSTGGTQTRICVHQ